MTVEYVVNSEVQNIVDLIGLVIDDVRAEYDPENNEKPYYLHGHPLEIVNTLIEKTQDAQYKFKKYPLIALFEDFEAEGPLGLFRSKAKLNIVIMTDSSSSYKATQRYEKSFNTILTPIYDLFLKHLKRRRGLHIDHKSIPHKPINHLYWGKKDVGNDGIDFIDAIELKELSIKVYRN
ncbi:hypothetical protein [Sunxiuqinia indica]|uniref:hypothetical protein n=1 Tax=Sunxiuqinia indica TaxID=2692584 RepID=UPI00135B2FF2|nr:hypothetical protein [Sunxiuqinia indica]